MLSAAGQRKFIHCTSVVEQKTAQRNKLNLSPSSNRKHSISLDYLCYSRVELTKQLVFAKFSSDVLEPHPHRSVPMLVLSVILVIFPRLITHFLSMIPYTV